jgi:hypothetical protein
MPTIDFLEHADDTLDENGNPTGPGPGDIFPRIAQANIVFCSVAAEEVMTDANGPHIFDGQERIGPEYTTHEELTTAIQNLIDRQISPKVHGERQTPVFTVEVFDFGPRLGFGLNIEVRSLGSAVAQAVEGMVHSKYNSVEEGGDGDAGDAQGQPEPPM